MVTSLNERAQYCDMIMRTAIDEEKPTVKKTTTQQRINSCKNEATARRMKLRLEEWNQFKKQSIILLDLYWRWYDMTFYGDW